MEIKSSLLLCATIIGVFLIPISFAEVIIEENPDDSSNRVLSQESPLEFEIKTLPVGTKKISLFTGDTIRAPYDTSLVVRMGNAQEFHTTLHNTLRNNRELVFSIDAPVRPMRIALHTPNLPLKKGIIIRTQRDNAHIPAYTLFTQKPLIVALVKKMIAQTSKANDIEYVWKEGGEILAGNNPYARASKGTQHSSKYATYFPLSYIISATIQKMGYTSLDSWMTIVRPLILFSQIFSATIVLYYLTKKRLVALGLLAFFIILFHRFTLYPARVTHIDFPAIAFLLLGTMLLSKKPKTAYALIGISLAIKQMAIFIIPLLLIYAWHQHKSKKQLVLDLLSLLFIPIITLAPFIFDNPTGTLQSILFSVEREATGDFASPDLATTLALSGASARVPLLGMLALVYLAAWRREIRIFGATLAVFILFSGFNPVLFFQYLAWIIPFIPLAISEAALSESPSQSSRRLRDT